MSNTILYFEINILCIFCLILISIKANRYLFLQAQRNGFLAVTITSMIFFSLDAMWVFVNGNMLNISVTINWLLNGLYFIVSGMFGYIWFCYSEIIQQSNFYKKKKLRIAAIIPELILIILVLSSYQSHLVFYIDSNNIYHRGPAFFLQLLLSYGYVVFTALKALISSFHTKDYGHKVELLTLSTYIIPTLIGGALQVIFSPYPIFCIGTTLGILYIFLSRLEQMVSVDMLTQLNNRNQLFQYLSVKLNHTTESRALYLLMIDVDKFKFINDQYGHIEGDRALRLIADCLRKSCSQRNFFISRYGGDEFTIICELDAEHSIDSVCKSINETISNVDVPYPLAVSIGYAKYTKDIHTQQDFFALADKELYKVKEQHHRAIDAKHT